MASRNRDRIEKSLIMKRNLLVLLAFSLIALPACNRDGNVNQADGVKDALDVTPQSKSCEMPAKRLATPSKMRARI